MNWLWKSAHQQSEAVIGETGYLDSDESVVAVAAAALVAAQCPGGEPVAPLR